MSVAHTNSAAAARETDAVVTDVSGVHDTALGSFGDSTGCDFDLGVSTDVLVEDLCAVKHGFRDDTVGLWNCQCRLQFDGSSESNHCDVG